MEFKKKQAILKEIESKYPGMREEDVDWEVGAILYKAGINEVAEWVNENIEMTAKRSDQWQSQLKKWGCNLF